MNKLAVSTLEEGQRYSAPVFMDEVHLLVPAQIPLRKKDLDFLKMLDIVEVVTDGVLLPNATEQVTAFVFNEGSAGSVPQAAAGKQPVPPPAAQQRGAAPQRAIPPAGGIPLAEGQKTALGAGSSNLTHQKLELIIKKLSAIFNEIAFKPKNVHPSANFSIRQLWSLTSVLLKLVKEEKTDVLRFILCGSIQGFDLAKSSINTSILSILIARELDLGINKVPEIAIAALLHDIGMLRLPPGIINKQGKLTPEEAGIIRMHTDISYKIINQELAYPQSVAAIALQHHERWDGTGYPHRLVGNAISAGARIVSVADAFEAMVSQKPYRNSMIGYLAMKNILSENAAHFSPAILKTFVKIMGMYPIGSGVTLNDGRIARVVAVRPEVPLRPTVVIIAEKGAQKVQNGETVDLLAQKNLFITQALDISHF